MKLRAAPKRSPVSSAAAASATASRMPSASFGRGDACSMSANSVGS